MTQSDKLRLRVIELTGLKNVYIEPPENFKMQYPCVRISRSSGYTQFANNMPYTHKRSYRLLLIDYDPESKYYKPLIMGLPMIRMNRHYVADNLHHDDMIIYF
ncbi:MAG: hypothetical protein KBT27_03515 [Prevotellaceae bacterium]|nr:hypothetical protein [Candidatus Faecinaster equi]